MIKIGDKLNDEWVDNAEQLMQVEMKMADSNRLPRYTFGIKQNEELVSATNPYGLITRGNNTIDVLLEIETPNK